MIELRPTRKLRGTMRYAGVAAVALACLLPAACGGGGASALDGSSTSSYKPDPNAYPSGDAAFKTKWASLIKAAQKEGSLVILDGPNVANGEGPVYQAFANEFGLKLTQVQGSPDQIVSRVLAERQQGLHTVDVAMAGGGATKRMIDANVFQPLQPLLISSEALDRSTGWPTTTIPWDPDDTAQKYVTSYSRRADANYVEIWYNTSKVKLSDINSWNDFLKPQYKGKIIIGDVADNAASNDRILGWLGLGGSDYWTKFMQDVKPAISPIGSSRDMSDALARGQYDFALYIDADDPFLSAQKDGLPVAQLQKRLSEGGPASPGGDLGVFDKPAHPAVTQLFVNWLLSKQGQTTYNALNKNADNVALRTDVPQGGIPDDVWSRATNPQAKFIPLDASFAQADSSSTAWWKQEFSSLGLK